jgi:cell division protein FtsI (penicillin-binding protein 3)
MMTQNDEHIIKRSLLVYSGLVLFALLIIVKLIHIQYNEGNKYRTLAQKYTVKEFKIKANRGNIYSEDGNIMATSVPKYDIAFDPTAPSAKNFNKYISGLSQKLSLLTGKPAVQLQRSFVKARQKNRKYIKILRGINYSDYQKIKQFPLFKLGMNKGGFIAEMHNERTYPLGKVLKRTIGFDRGPGNRAGIEGAFAKYLNGKDGMQKKQKIKYGVWKPLSDINDIEPKDGYDIITNINLDIQDIAHQTLLKQLQKYEAEHGSVVVMDVKTGAIKAMVNLGKTKSGSYEELRNYAVFETHEPGSTFKLFSVMALLEDKIADTSTVVNTGKGFYEIYKKHVRDAHKGGLGKLTLKQVFEKSSNVGVVKMVYENYKKTPEKFVNRLYNFGIHEKVGIDIKGEGTPHIPDPKEKGWNGISLPWMAYGYGVELTDIQILAYYNAIANNGKLMKPYLVKEIRSFNHSIKKFKPTTLNSSIASEETIKKMQDMLKGVVLRGTATNINNPYVSIAGKTGTAQTEYWKGKGQYIASFVGYFPADNPKYSMIVVIHKPNPEKGYYGNIVAAPIFKTIAEYIYGKMPQEIKLAKGPLPIDRKTEQIASKYKTIMPDLKGLSSKNAIYILENMGVKVKLKGSGKVIGQSVPRGVKVKRNQIIELKLS